MYLKYGTYTHEVDEAALVISRQPVRTDFGQIYAHREIWSISGILHGDDHDELKTNIDALEAAYAKNGKDITLYRDNGTATAHQIINAQTWGGVEVTAGVDYPEGRGAEYSTFRSYSITVEATVPVSGSRAKFVRFTETLTTAGGGPRLQWLELSEEPPQRFTLNRYTTYKATQSGEAVGLLAYPLVPRPIWPDALMANPEVSYGPPKVSAAVAGQAPQLTEFPVSWSYQFESATPLNGRPNVRA